jgi:hypothetical protein
VQQQQQAGQLLQLGEVEDGAAVAECLVLQSERDVLRGMQLCAVEEDALVVEDSDGKDAITRRLTPVLLLLLLLLPDACMHRLHSIDERAGEGGLLRLQQADWRTQHASCVSARHALHDCWVAGSVGAVDAIEHILDLCRFVVCVRLEEAQPALLIRHLRLLEHKASKADDLRAELHACQFERVAHAVQARRCVCSVV